MTFALLDRNLLRLQPLVFVQNDVYAKTRTRLGDATLVTSFRVQHQLRRVGAIGTMLDHQQRRSWPVVEDLLEHELGRNAASSTDPLVYFLEHLTPAFRQRDWKDTSQLTEVVATDSSSSDWSNEVAGAQANFPRPSLPAPSLCVLGRVWLLEEASATPGRLGVICAGINFSVTGEFVTLGALEQDWHERTRAYVASTAARLAKISRSDSVTDQLVEAREELGKTGVLQAGDLLFIGGTPCLLGHVLPAHYNSTLARQSQRDLAIATPLQSLPRVGDLTVYEQGVDGRWRPIRVPHGLCLGPPPPHAIQDDKGLNLAAYLRWAAIRLASNGKFHEND